MALRTINTVSYFADLRLRMSSAGVTSGALAAAMKVDPAQLSRWMSGSVDPKLSSVERIEAALESILA